MLKNNRFAVFVVGEIRDKNGFYKNFVGDTIQAFLDTGVGYYNDIILYTVIGSLPVRVTKQFQPYRKIGKVHQNILVFYKGDPKLCQEMDMELNAFKPLNELGIEKIERDASMHEPRSIQEEDVEEIKIEEPKETTICELCGVDYRGSTKDEHEARQFHQDRINS